MSNETNKVIKTTGEYKLVKYDHQELSDHQILLNKLNDVMETLREINSKINHIENRLRAGFGS